MYNNNAKTSTMFTDLKKKRSSWEEIWKLCAQYTLPQIYLEDSVRESGIEPEDLVIGDSIGAEGLNNFISQILKIAFPAQGAFFRVERKKDAVGLSAISSSKQQDVYRRMEEAAMEALYTRGLHAQKFMMLATLVGLGDVVYRVPKGKDSKIQIYDMNDVVIKRTRNGKIADVIIKECTEYRFLSDEARATLIANGKKKTFKEDDEVDLYTHLTLNKNNKYTIKTAVNDVQMNTPLNFFACNKCEFQVGSLTTKRGAHYSTGVVQQYIPLIHKANVYADTGTDTAVAGSLVNWAVHPQAAIRPEEWANREQGQPFALKAGDIEAVTANVGQHLQIVALQYEHIVSTLQRIFLLPQAVQRDAERVTAQEILTIARKLEETHSGLYAMIAENLQRPLAYLGLDLIDDEELNKYKDEVEVKIVTAMEAQSRGMELDNMLASLGDSTIFNSVPPQVQERLKLDPVLSTIFNNRNVNASEYVKTDEEFAAEQQAIAEREAQAAQAQQPQAPALSQTQVFQPNQGLLEDIRKPMI